MTSLIRMGEFVDTLFSLLRGNTLVVADVGTVQAVIDGNMTYYSLAPLVKYGVVEEFDNPGGFENILYFRLTEKGRDFAQRAVKVWQELPIYERLAIRFLR